MPQAPLHIFPLPICHKLNPSIAPPLPQFIKHKLILQSSHSLHPCVLCFITDAGNCGGLENDEGWDLDNEDRCKEEGYNCTPCPGGSEAVDICPYDKDCHKSCKNTCDSAYNKSCNGADETGKGDSCNGLYQECCNLCSDYPYTDGNLPTGYVKGASCNSCTGTKYKASCNTAYQYTCTGSHQSGGSGTACDGKYKSCTCQSGYGWNSTTGTCDISCDTAYKFDCIKSSSTHISGGDGSACNSKYQRCTCTTPYSWSSTDNACTCPTTYKYTCTEVNQTGGSGTACGDKYKKCTCKSPYSWSSGKCVCPSTYIYTCNGTGEIGSGTACNGKYQSCVCDNSYKYACIGVGAGYAGGSGYSCGGLYPSCICTDGYEWNSNLGSCELITNCQGKSNGENGNYYCCDNDVVAVKTSGMDFYVAMQDFDRMTWSNADSQCKNYSFCSNVKGTLPTKEQLLSIYNNKSSINTLLSTNGGSIITENYYWSSTTITPNNQTYYYYLVNMTSGDGWNDAGDAKLYVRAIVPSSSSAPCYGKSNGANGNYYCCDNDVVGVKTEGMDFYIAMQDLGDMNWNSANTQASSYVFCGNKKGKLPTQAQLLTIYTLKSSINQLLSSNKGTKFSYETYWSSTSHTVTGGFYYFVNISTGDTNYTSTSYNANVRPVF